MLIDILIVIIFLLCLVRGWRKGLLYNAGLVFMLLIAFFIASTFSGLLSAKLYQLGVEQGILQASKPSFSKQLASEADLTTSLQDLGLTESYQNILKGDMAGVFKDLSSSVEMLGAQSKAYMDEMTQAISEHILRLSLQILVFLVLIFASYFVLKWLLKWLSKGINALPVLGLANRLGGAALGFALAVLLAGTLLSLLPGLGASLPAVEQGLRGSQLAGLISESQLYKFILNSIF